MKRSHLRLVGSGGKPPQQPRPRARKSIMRKIEDLSESHESLCGYYEGNLLPRETQRLVRDRLSDLVRELLSRAPRRLYEAADLAKVVAVNSDMPEAADAIRALAAFYKAKVAAAEKGEKAEDL